MPTAVSSPPATLPLRLCILTETYHPIIGGGETQARRLAEGLAAHGVRTLILTRRVSAAHPASELAGEISIFRLPPVGRQHWKKWGLLLSSFFALLRYKYHYDIILVSGYRVLGIAAILAGRLVGKRVVLKADSTGEFSGEFFAGGLKKIGLRPDSWVTRGFLQLRNRLLAQADCFIAISSIIRNELEKPGGIPPSKIVDIPNAVDTRLFAPVDKQAQMLLREQLGMPAERIIAIYTGRLVTYKGFPFLVRAWGKVIEQHPEVCLYLVGVGSLDIHNCEAELREYVKTSGLEDHVVFVGEVNNVQAYLQAADFFVFPTEDEAFGVSLVEAMACGLPVITTPVGGVKDIITSERNGLMIHPRDERGLLGAINRLITDKHLAMQLGQTAVQTVQDRYSISHITQAYFELLTRLVNSR